MEMAELYSKKMMTERDSIQYQPDEIETFVMLAVKNKEWKKDVITFDDYRRCIEGIRHYHSPYLFNKTGDDFAYQYIQLASATQFIHQIHPYLIVSRYYSYFTHQDNSIDMKQIFYDKFGFDYQDILIPAVILWLSLILNKSSTKKTFLWLRAHFRAAFDTLSISRDNYIKELDEHSNTQEDYRYCLRPSYSWPFIEEKNVVYCPTPHLILIAATSSLLFRITDSNDRLRERIGKNVIESYLANYARNSDLFDEVLAEQTYKKHKQELRTLDVMASINGIIVCFDSKSLSPAVSMRIFDEKGYESTKIRMVKALKQVYLHIHDRFGKDYSYLHAPLTEERENIFGFVVVLEDPYFSLKELYKAVAEELRINEYSDEYDWLTKHVGVVGMDLLEKQFAMATKQGFINCVQQHIKSGSVNDYWFTHIDGEMKRPPDFFLQFFKNCVNPVLQEMQADGIESPI